MKVITIKKKIEKVFEGLVESETKAGAYYIVKLKDMEWECTCPDASKRGNLCKHIREVKERESL